MRIKKKDLLESKYIVQPDELDKIKDDIEDEDTIHIIDEEDCEDCEEEVIDENVKPIITKKELINFIKESKL